MTEDGLNALKLGYNYLNLTSEVRDLSDNFLAKYRWLADGTKAGATTGDGASGLEYLGSLIYKRVNGELQLESTDFGGGRIEVSEGSNGAIYTPNYYITDHLGSTRVTFDQDRGITSRNNFLPFGMQWQDRTAKISDNRWLYNGKELQNAVGLNYLDYGARMRDSRLGPWNGIDPLAEDHSPESPFGFAGNNPIKNVDPNGEDYWSTSDPEEIKRLLDVLKTKSFPRPGSSFHTFDFSSWETHYTDAQVGEMISNAWFNDETGRFYASYTIQRNGVLTVIGLSADAYMIFDGSATLRSRPLAGGGIQENNILFDILSGWGIGRSLIKKGGEALIKRAAARVPARSVGAAVKGFTKGSFKAVDAKLLSKNGINNIHKFKQNYLGKNVSVSKFDVVRNTQSGELLIISKKTQEIVEYTGVIIK